MSDFAEIVVTFSATYLSGRPIYVWLCRDFDFHTEQLSSENRPTFRRIQTGLLCKARSNIFNREVSIDVWFYVWIISKRKPYLMLFETIIHPFFCFHFSIAGYNFITLDSSFQVFFFGHNFMLVFFIPHDEYCSCHVLCWHVHHTALIRSVWNGEPEEFSWKTLTE